MEEYDKYKKGFLNNGIEYILLDLPEKNNFGIYLYVKTGSKNEYPKYNGISHLLEHMLFTPLKI